MQLGSSLGRPLSRHLAICRLPQIKRMPFDPPARFEVAVGVLVRDCHRHALSGDMDTHAFPSGGASPRFRHVASSRFRPRGPTLEARRICAPH